MRNSVKYKLQIRKFNSRPTILFEWNDGYLYCVIVIIWTSFV